MYGYKPPHRISYVSGATPLVAVDDLLTQRSNITQLLQDNLSAAHVNMEVYAHQRRSERVFVEGDWFT